MAAVTFTERLVRRERLLLWLALALLCGLSWTYLWFGAGTGMDTLRMTTWEFPLPRPVTTASSWSLAYWLLMLLMWWVMMIAMMLPSAAPMILLFARVVRFNSGEQAVPPTALFLTGYLLAWLGFSLVATALQWLLEQWGLVHGMLMWSTDYRLSAGLLLLAGLYQFSSLKTTCLQHCRSPAAYLSSHWLPGGGGALLMGWRHGVYCLGCCWSMMLLLFVGGTMNLVWIAGLTLLVLLEKLLPRGPLLARLAGAVMSFAGICLLLL